MSIRHSSHSQAVSGRSFASCLAQGVEGAVCKEVERGLDANSLLKPTLHSHDFFARVLRWNSLQSELLWIYDGPLDAESPDITSDHRHGYRVWLVREGEVRLQMGESVWTAGAGKWIVSPHGSAIRDFSPGTRILSLHFCWQWSTGENFFTDQGALIMDASEFPHLERCATRLERLVRKFFPGVRFELLQQRAAYPVFLKLQQRFQQWLIVFFEAMTQLEQTLSRAGEGDERLWRAAECLHSTLLDGPFPAAQLQRETSMGRAQLDRLFLKEFGATTREYWEQLRQNSAINSLVGTSISIKEIGYRLGFKQPSHFTKWFFRRMGINPQDYRVSALTVPQFLMERQGEDYRKKVIRNVEAGASGALGPAIKAVVFDSRSAERNVSDPYDRHPVNCIA